MLQVVRQNYIRRKITYVKNYIRYKILIPDSNADVETVSVVLFKATQGQHSYAMQFIMQYKSSSKNNMMYAL